MRASRWLLIGGFLAALALPVADMRLHVSPSFAGGEKRTLAPPPTLSWEARAQLPRQFEEYFQDHFGFRELLVRWHALASMYVLDRSPVANVILGKDGWLFYAALKDGADIGDFRGRMPLGPDELLERRKTLAERASALAAHGIPYVFVVVPNKHSVYPELLPERIGPRRAGNRLDQFMAIAPGAPGLTVVDLRDALRAARADGDVYFRSDTHWNLAGAFAAARAILAAAGPKFRAPAAEDFDRPLATGNGGDLAAMLGLLDRWSETQLLFVPRPSAPPPLPLKVVIVGDSFREGLRPFLDRTFAEVRSYHFVDDGGFVLERILADKPDLVIDERCERYLMR